MTSTAQNMRCTVMSEMANLRSSGFREGFLSRYGAMTSRKRPMPGMVTPATIGWNMVRSSWSPRKYQGAFEGFGVLLKSANSRSGAFTKIEKSVVNRVMMIAARNSATSRCGQTWTLSVGMALVSWMEPDLTTVSSRWLWPSGPEPCAGPDGTTAAPSGGVEAGVSRSRSSAGTFSPASSPPGAGASPPALAAAALARASSARLRRCSGISVIVCPLPTAARRCRRPCGPARSGSPRR